MKKILIIASLLLLNCAVKEQEELCDCSPYQSTTLSKNGCADDKTYVCHNGISLCINDDDIEAHLNHGDVLGECKVLSTEEFEYDECKNYCLNK